MQISGSRWCERIFSEQKRISLLHRVAKHISRKGRRRNMHIAQVAPLYESVPPKQYGGTERIVSYLTEELVRQGHDVTLFASGDSETSGRLVAGCPQALWQDPNCRETLPHHVRLVERVIREAHRFDVIHFHLDYVHFPVPGRVPPEKGLDRAVEFARRVGMPLRVAAKIYPEERPYFDQEIAPLFRASPWVEFIGEVGGRDKDEFLGHAHALLFPIDWAEPF